MLKYKNAHPTHNITLSRPKNLQSDKNKRINNDHPFAILKMAIYRLIIMQQNGISNPL
jgi:hypothetical protein